jgi:hypothetical protein
MKPDDVIKHCKARRKEILTKEKQIKFLYDFEKCNENVTRFNLRS